VLVAVALNIIVGSNLTRGRRDADAFADLNYLLLLMVLPALSLAALSHECPDGGDEHDHANGGQDHLFVQGGV